jgi:lipid-binding SYLF domain-containing protein
MRTMRLALMITLALALSFTMAQADDDPGTYEEAKGIFVNAGQSGNYFDMCYGYALFPTVGKGGIGVGAAHGEGRVYRGGEWVGNTKLNQLSIGLQLGGQAYSQIIFFKDKRAFDEFTSGEFEFGAQASAVAITAGASAKSSTSSGSTAGASGGKNDATTAGGYYKGMATFTVAKGGLMYEASIGGQKFKYSAR